MQSAKNVVIIAAAGSRKTTSIVEDALAQGDKKVLITTYTIENVRCIESYIVRKNGFIPDNITVMSWYQFLLKDGARPYQNTAGQVRRVQSINFVAEHDKFAKKDELRYFIDRGDRIYRDVVSDFVFQCNSKSSGAVIARMEKLYDVIYVDEIQDLSGYDLDLLELMMASTIAVKMVGDPRQSTYSTNRSQRYKQFRGSEIVKWFEALEKKKKLVRKEWSDCYRCNQAICDFADAIYPSLPKTVSKNLEDTGHDGVFQIPVAEVAQYVAQHKPRVLRHDRRSNTHGHAAMNFGAVKGATYDRVLIFPTAKMKQYLTSRDHTLLQDKARFYVAVTRARYSVAFVV